jgi:drug/metabolite transporter (DMT)-like permease
MMAEPHQPRPPSGAMRVARGGWARGAAGVARIQGNRVALGIFFMVLATSLFPFMNGAVQLLSPRYSTDQIVWARVTSHLAFMLILFLPRDGLSLFRTRQLGVQFKRSVCQLMSTSFYFTAIKYLPLAQATTISFTTPFFVAALARPILGERLGFYRLMTMLVAFIGVLIIVRPGTNVFHWATVGVLLSALFYGLYQVYTRGVAGYDSPSTSVVYSVMLATLVMSVVMLFRWKTPESWTDVALMCSLGFFGGLGHFFLAKAMTYAPANVVAPFQYWQLIGAVGVGYMISGYMPDLYTWIGAAVIIGAGLYLGWRDTRAKAAVPPFTGKVG